jgi:hypothetical protein
VDQDALSLSCRRSFLAQLRNSDVIELLADFDPGILQIFRRLAEGQKGKQEGVVRYRSKAPGISRRHREDQVPVLPASLDDPIVISRGTWWHAGAIYVPPRRK